MMLGSKPGLATQLASCAIITVLSWPWRCLPQAGHLVHEVSAECSFLEPTCFRVGTRLKTQGVALQCSSGVGLESRMQQLRVLEALRADMVPDGATWAASVNERRYLERYVVTLSYLWRYCTDVSGRLPASLDTKQAEEATAALQSLQAACESQFSAAANTVGVERDEYPRVPRYFYAQMMRRAGCVLLPGAERLHEDQLLSLLAVQVVACERAVQRFLLLAGRDLGGGPFCSQFRLYAEQGAALSSRLAGAMLHLASEDAVRRELASCALAEAATLRELRGLSQGIRRLATLPALVDPWLLANKALEILAPPAEIRERPSSNWGAQLWLAE